DQWIVKVGKRQSRRRDLRAGLADHLVFIILIRFTDGAYPEIVGRVGLEIAHGNGRSVLVARATEALEGAAGLSRDQDFIAAWSLTEGDGRPGQLNGGTADLCDL